MEIFNRKESRKRRRNLRKNLTDAEKALWEKLRRKQFEDLRFLRQYGIGDYSADFYCPERKLVIEIDGGQHFSEAGRQHDKRRESYMKSLGIVTLRFTNLDVLTNIEGVSEKIREVLRENT